MDSIRSASPDWRLPSSMASSSLLHSSGPTPASPIRGSVRESSTSNARNDGRFGEGVTVGNPTTTTSGSTAMAMRVGEAAFTQMEKVGAEFFALTYGALVHEMLMEAMGTTAPLPSSSSASATSPSPYFPVEEELCDASTATVEQVEQVNQQLLEAGRRIGTRLIEEYSAVTLQIHQTNATVMNARTETRGKNASPSPSPSCFPPNRCRTFAQATEGVALVGLRMFLGVTATVTELHDYPDSFSLVLSSNPLTMFVELPEGPMRRHLCYSNILCGVIMGALSLVGFQAEVRMTLERLRGDDVDEVLIRYTGRDNESFQVSK